MEKKESALTDPSERDTVNRMTFDTNAQPLTDDETKLAKTELVVKEMVTKFPRLERRYEDPPIDLQTYILISFIPAKGATPNQNGVYGWAKVRGVYPTLEQADTRCEYLLKNVDSYHKVFYGFVGRPFPITESSDYSKEIAEVEIKNQLTESVSNDVKQKREKEQKEIEEIKEKEKLLLEDVKKLEEDNHDDRYKTLRVKNAQLVWTFIETEKKLDTMKTLLAKARKEIEEMDEKYPEAKDTLYQSIIDARRQAGISQTRAEEDTSYMRYLGMDVSIPAVDEEYNRLFKDE